MIYTKFEYNIILLLIVDTVTTNLEENSSEIIQKSLHDEVDAKGQESN